jgi:hypothetical protein
MSHRVTRVRRQLLGVASRERRPVVIKVRTGLHPFCKARRVASRRAPAGDFDYEVGGGDYAARRRADPRIAELVHGALGAARTVVNVGEVPVAIDCTDGFTEAFYARPEAFLDPDVRAAQSAWGFVAPDAVQRGMARLAEDLAAGRWDAEHGHLRSSPTFTGSLRLVVSTPASGCSYSSSG